MAAQSVTAKAILDTRYKKQNADTYPVRLRVTFQRKHKYYPINISLTEKEWLQIQKRVRLNTELSNHLTTIQNKETEAINKINELGDRFSWDSFEGKEKPRKFVADGKGLADAFDRKIKLLRDNGKIGTATNYTNSRDSLLRFFESIGNNGPSISDVTKDFLNAYKLYMQGDTSGEDRDRRNGTIGFYLRPLRAMLNEMIGDGTYSFASYPFGKHRFTIPVSQKTRVEWYLTSGDMQKLERYTGYYNEDRDLFLFMFLNAGINLTDVALLKWRNIKIRDKYTVLEFVRAKTKREDRTHTVIKLPLSERVLKLIGDRKKEDEYIFPILDNAVKNAGDIDKVIHDYTNLLNKRLKKIAKEGKLDNQELSTTYARHTAATVLRDAGIHNSVIGELMGHKLGEVTAIYQGESSLDLKAEALAHLSRYINRLKKVA